MLAGCMNGPEVLDVGPLENRYVIGMVVELAHDDPPSVQQHSHAVQAGIACEQWPMEDEDPRAFDVQWRIVGVGNNADQETWVGL